MATTATNNILSHYQQVQQEITTQSQQYITDNNNNNNNNNNTAEDIDDKDEEGLQDSIFQEYVGSDPTLVKIMTGFTYDEFMVIYATVEKALQMGRSPRGRKSKFAPQDMLFITLIDLA